MTRKQVLALVVTVAVFEALAFLGAWVAVATDSTRYEDPDTLGLVMGLHAAIGIFALGIGAILLLFYAIFALWDWANE